MKDLLIKCGAIVTVNKDDEVIKDGVIVVNNGIIEYVGNGIDVLLDDYSKVIDEPFCVAIPGLINVHNHASMSLFRGYADDLPLHEWLHDKIFPIEAKLTASFAYYGALLSSLEMIKSGTTTFADMYFFMDDVARACVDTGIRAALSFGMSSSKHDDVTLIKAEEFVKNWSHNGRISTMLGPHAPYTCDVDFLKKTAKLASNLDVGIHIHLSETRKENDDIRKEHGISPTKLLKECGIFENPTLAAHCVQMDDDDIDILAGNKVKVAYNPCSNMKLASGIAPITKMHEKGVVVGIGTDGPASNNDLDMFQEMKTASLLQKVATFDPLALNAVTTLRMATIEGAKCLMMDDITGTIEKGKSADIVLVNTDAPHLVPYSNYISHLVYSACGHDVKTSIIGGEIVLEDKKFLRMNEDEIKDKANRAFRELVKSI